MTAHPLICLAWAGIEAIDLRPAQDAIRARHGPDYHLSEACLWEVAALWGIERGHGAINSAGVFTSGFHAVDVSTGRSRAEICIACSPSGLWAMETCFWTPTYGASAAPGVWNPVAFRCDDDARRAGLEALIARFRTFAAMDGSDGSDARKMIDRLVSEKTLQLRLF